jgi:hypothetical protein
VEEDEKGSLEGFCKLGGGGSSQICHWILHASISGAIERSRYLNGVEVGCMPVYICISDERM